MTTKPKMLFIVERRTQVGREPPSEWIKDVSFKKAGFEVIPFFHQYVSKDIGRVRMNLALKELASKHKPDIIHMEKCPSIESGTLKEIRKSLPKTTFTMWYGDMRGINAIEPWFASRLPQIDILLVSSSDKRIFELYQKEWRCRGLKERKVHEWQLAAMPEYHWKRLEQIPLKYQLHFGGTNYGGLFPESAFRASLLYAIDQQFSLQVQGRGWGSLKNFNARILDKEDYPKIIAQSLLTIGVNAYSDIANYYNRRLFMDVGAGRFHITKYIKNMERDFVKGTHLDWFKTQEEALELISLYAAHTKSTLEKGKQASSWLHKQHSWLKRALQYRHLILGDVEWKDQE